MERLDGTSCGLNWGQLATADEKGKVLLPTFCDERDDSVYIEDANDTTIWPADPRAWQGRKVVRVEVKDALPGSQ